MGPLLLRRGRWRILTTRWRALLLVAVIEVVLPFSLITLGQRDVTSGTTGVLIATEPIFVAVIALAIARGRGLPLRGWLGLAIGIVGVVTLLGIEVTGPGAFLIVLAALSYATGAILISRLFAATDPLVSTAAMILTATPILVIIAAVFEPFTVPTPSAAAALLVLGLACTGAGFTSFFMLIKRAGPTTASLTAYVAPIVALLAGVLVLGEQITLIQILGCALILAGAGLVMRAEQAARAVQPSATNDQAPTLSQ
jgi:drug/metabolite transporter (DMT)-like permease